MSAGPDNQRTGAGAERLVDVAISIVNHANRDLLQACLGSLPAACAGLEWRVTVIDNVSGDRSLEMLAQDFPDVAVIANPVRMGFAANHNQVLHALARNRSARHALVLNDDTVLRSGAVTKLAALLDRDRSLGAVAPTITTPEGATACARLRYPSAGSALRMDLGLPFERADPGGGWLQGCCLMLRVDALADVGGFDPRFFLFFEDCDLSRRLQASGWSLAVSPTAVVVHIGHASVLRADFAPMTPRQGLRSRYLYFAKHAGPRRARTLALAGRALLAVRGCRASLAARHNPEARGRATQLLSLARYDPRRPLPHEAPGYLG